MGKYDDCIRTSKKYLQPIKKLLTEHIEKHKDAKVFHERRASERSTAFKHRVGCMHDLTNFQKVHCH